MPMENGPGRGATVLLVEDDDAVRRSLQLLLHWRGYDVRAYPAASPLLHGDGAGGDILIADYRLPDATGCDLRRALGERGWTGRSVLITGYASAALTADARGSGFAVVLGKPLRQQALFAALA